MFGWFQLTDATNGSETNARFEYSATYGFSVELPKMGKRKKAIIKAFTEHYIISELPSDIAFLILQYAFDIEIGRSSLRYWYFCSE